MSSTTNPNPIPGCYNCDGTGHDEMMNCACDCQGWDAVKGTRTLAGAGMNATQGHVRGTGRGEGRGTGRDNVATIKQISYLRSLVEGADQTNPVVIRAAAAMVDPYGMPKRVASEWIDTMRGVAAMATTPITAGTPTTGTTTPTAGPVVANRYPGKCATCGHHVAENAGRRERGAGGKWLVFHLDGCCPQARTAAPQAPTTQAPVDGIDLTPLMAYGTKQSTGATTVRFGVPGGDTRLKLMVKFATDGRIWVTDAAAYGQRQTYGVQTPGHAYRGKVEDALRAVLADPTAGAIRYSELTSTCASCGRKLELATSVAQGMGSVCAGKFGL